MIIYATADDLATWSETLDDDCDPTAALRSASLRVAEAIAGDYYTTDDTGLPTDPVALQALNDATCCHALALLTLKIDPNTGGAATTGVVTSVGIGSARKTFADATQAAAARACAAGQLVPDALLILRQAGMATTRVWSYG